MRYIHVCGLLLLMHFEGLVYLSTPVAGFVSGLVAYGVQENLNLDMGLGAWQWLFIVLGVPAVPLGIITVIFLPDLPHKVIAKGHFLFPTAEERDLIIARTSSGEHVLLFQLI